MGHRFARRKKMGVQISAIVMLTETGILNLAGIIINPLDILAESPLRKHSKPKKFLLATFSPFSIS